MNYLVATEAGTGHACQLAVVLRKYIELESIYIFKSAHKLDFIDSEAKIKGDFPDKGELIIVFSVFAYGVLIQKKGSDYFSNFKRVVIILTDSVYMSDYKKYNIQFSNFDVFANNCKMQYREGLPTKVYYQPFDLDGYNYSKREKLTLGHSPFGSTRKDAKGTEQIGEIFKQSKCDYDIIQGLEWVDCMVRKSKCHIFVDQISHITGALLPDDWMGGIGKSGLEAMLLKCLVITRMNKVDYDIPAPPVVLCNEDNIKEILAYYIKNKKERELIIKQQYEWAKKYLNPDFCAKRILDGVF